MGNKYTVDQNGNITTSGNITVEQQIQIKGGAPGAGKVLTASDTNGNSSWTTLPTSVAGSDTQIQYNNNGILDGDVGFTYNNTTKDINVQGKVTAGGVVGVDTNFGTDSERLRVTATSEDTFDNTRAASIDLHGNQHPSKPGELDLVAGGNVGDVNVWTNGQLQATFEASGNLTLEKQLQVKGGAPGTGKVLTSDANGLASWEVIASAPVTDVFGRVGNVVAQNNDYTGAQITNVPFGSLTSTTAQAAINELETNKAEVGGATTQVQYNNNGQLAGSSNFTFNNTVNSLNVGGAITAGGVVGVDTTISNDNERLRITAAPEDTFDNTRAASIDLHGNQHPTKAGDLDLVAGGNTSGVNVWTNGTQQAVINSAGNVGVNVSAPTNKVDVAANIRTGSHTNGAPLYVTGNITPSTGVEIKTSDGTQGIGIGSNTLYAAGSNTNQQMNIVAKGTGSTTVTANGAVLAIGGSTGNVGVGAVTPNEKLTVDGVFSLQTQTVFPSSTTSYGKMFTRPAAGKGNDSSCALLLHFEGTLDDASTTQKNFISVGSASTSTLQSKFGTSSLLLNGTNQGITWTNPSSMADFNAVDFKSFTIDAWIRPSVLTGIQPIFTAAKDNNNYIELRLNANLLQFIFQSGGGGFEVDISSNNATSPITANTWSHVAVTRTYNATTQEWTTRIYVNGTVQATTGTDNKVTEFNSGVDVGHNAIRSATNFFSGNIDELRFSTIARYSTSFTPESGQYGTGLYYMAPNGITTEMGVSGGAGSIASPSTSGSTGSIQYNNNGVFGSDSAALFWDITNKRLGIGTSTPQANLHVNGRTWLGIRNTASTDHSLSTTDITHIVSPTNNSGAIIDNDIVARMIRSGTPGTKYNMAADWRLGTYATGLNSQTELTLRLANAGTHTPDVDVVSFRGDKRIVVEGQLQIKGGVPGANKVLTSDANGLASWVANSTTIGGATTQIQFNNGGVFAGDSGLVYNSTSKYLGIGNSISTPSYALHISSESATSASSAIVSENCSNSANGPLISLWKSRGTKATPTAIQTGDSVGVITGVGYNGTEWKQTGDINWRATENWTVNGQGTDFRLSTCRTGNTNSTIAYQINSNQQHIFNRGAVLAESGVVGRSDTFIGPVQTWPNRLRLTATNIDTQNSSQSSSVDVHGVDHPTNAGHVDLVAGGANGNVRLYTGGIERVTINQLGTVTVNSDLVLASNSNTRLTLGSMDAINEGGEILWVGAGSHNAWVQDIYQNNMRFYTDSQAINSVSFSNIGTGRTDLSVEGYTTLGDNTAIRVKKLTGTTSPTQGGSVNILHGVTTAKIISVTVLIEFSFNAWIPAHYTHSSGYLADFQYNSTNIIIQNSSSSSANILSKPVKIMITYEE